MANPVTIYTSDRGDAYNVATMETSHLINVITHHLQQRKTLEALELRVCASSSVTTCLAE